MTAVLKGFCHLSATCFQQGQRITQNLRLIALVLALWSFCEALVWFILPDFILLPLAILASRYRWHAVVISLLFSMLGSLVMICWVQNNPAGVAEVIFHLPFTQPFMIQKVEAFDHQYGVWSAMWQPFSAIPIKVWTYTALTSLQWPPGMYLFLVGVGRGIRMILIATIGGWLAKRFPQVIQCYWLGWILGYTIIFFVFLLLTSRAPSVPVSTIPSSCPPSTGLEKLPEMHFTQFTLSEITRSL